MTMKKIVTDGIGVAALVTAARKIYDILDAHNVQLGMILDGGPDGGPVVVVTSLPGAGNPSATVTSNPQLWAYVEDPQPVPVEHELEGDKNHLWGGRSCVCVGECCNDAEQYCICPECEEPGHTHTGRPRG